MEVGVGSDVLLGSGVNVGEGVRVSEGKGGGKFAVNSMVAGGVKCGNSVTMGGYVAFSSPHAEIKIITIIEMIMFFISITFQLTRGQKTQTTKTIQILLNHR